MPTAAADPTCGPLLFLWGSQTGGAESLAKKFTRDAVARGFQSKAASLGDFSPADLPGAKRACIITSTYGDGEMPDNAQAFWETICNGSAPRLDGLEFSVLALGDRNYVQFCEAGALFDRRLEELGARRIHPRRDCDVDYEVSASEWISGVFQAIAPEGAGPFWDVPGKPPAGGYGKTHPFPAVLKTNRILSGPGSAKETRHFEIVLEGSGLAYEAGDALGVQPQNCPDFVGEILAAAKCSGEEPVEIVPGKETGLRPALLSHFDLAPFLTLLPSGRLSPGDLVKPLRRLQPRLYSISSSPKAHPGEVHLTVGIVRYELEGRLRKGACSTFLAERSGGTVPVFIHHSPSFRLPRDPATPVIMVGPGTGIAPFRAFLEERRAIGAAGPNWLFFGDQRASSDFLYREELEAMRSDGFLNRLDTAFSRDQAEKIYVQHRMLEHAVELWRWLEEGACLYVCGDAKRMAKDVDATLHEIARQEGSHTEDSARECVARLKKEKRYLRDVY